MLLATAIAVFAAADAKAAYYKMVSCAGNNGIAPYATYTNTAHAGAPAGIFEFHNWCAGQGGDPPGNLAHVRINENQPSGNAGHEAVGWMAWYTPPGVHFLAAGGYTRQPNAFNQGWRSRFWGADAAGNGFEAITQGAGLPHTGTQRPISSVFTPHLWPFGHYLHFHAFVFELRCVRPAGCDRANYNATDLNGLVFMLSDDSNSQVALTNTATPPRPRRRLLAPQIRGQRSEQQFRKQALKLARAAAFDLPCDRPGDRARDHPSALFTAATTCSSITASSTSKAASRHSSLLWKCA